MEYSKKINQLSPIDVIGVLATDEEIQEETNKIGASSIFVNRNTGFIHYYIKLISRVTELNTYNASSNYFMGYLSCIKGYEDKDNINENDEVRIQNFKDFFKEFYFVFNFEQPSLGGKFCKITSAHIVKKKSKLNDKQLYIATPIFTPMNDTIKYKEKSRNYKEFMDHIKEKRRMDFIEGYKINENTSFCIVWQDDEKTIAIGPFKASIDVKGEYILEYDVISEFSLSDEMLEGVVYTSENKNIIHLPENTYDTIYKQLVTQINNEQKSTLLQTDEEVKSSNDDNIININSQEKSDTTIIDLFKYNSQKAKLFYDIEDLINFHTAIKTGNLVILSGISGTGKSRIVDCYAKALGIENAVTIPVRPSWNDDSDLLGYVDLVHMVYRPSDTGFVKILIEAERNPNKIFLVCFDEMNLSRVEHYFSQFLSILEKPDGQRKLKLYDEGLAQRLYNSSEYKSEIIIGNNIKFIGTVNIDESTYHFSDKVLDRSNVINLNILDYSKEWKLDKYGYVSPVHWSSEDFDKISINKNDSIMNNTMTVRQKEFLWELHKMISQYCVGLGIGPRIVNQIELYIANLPNSEKDEYNISVGKAFDLQVKQRVLTKVRGTEEQLQELLGVAKDVEKEQKYIIDIFNLYSDISNFELCRRCVEEKRKELKVYGYCV